MPIEARGDWGLFAGDEVVCKSLAFSSSTKGHDTRFGLVDPCNKIFIINAQPPMGQEPPSAGIGPSVSHSKM
jgi:hypothetical protein